MARTLLLAFALFFNHAYAMIQLKDFYPYGLKNGDRNQTRRNDDQFDGPLKLKVPYPFFSGVYKSLYVNTNGAVSFKKGIRQYTPEAFPLNDTMLTPFWADVDTRNWGQIYFRETQDPALLLRASKEIQDIFLTHMDFTARSLYITTWYDVTYYGGNNATSRNTFQSIMVTDGRSSFVIFLYNEIHWTTGTASGGTQDGLNGVAAQVGFNAGDGKNYYAVNGSRTGAIINIGSMSNVGQPGKWVFRTDDLDIKDPECNLNGKADISLNPNKVQLKGGDVIFISGPCFKKSMDIRCQFGSVQVTGSFESVLRVSCVVPPNLNPGVTNVGLSTDGGKTVTNIQTPLTIQCNAGTWGPPSCTNRCPPCARGSVCDPVTGQCPNSCAPGYSNPPQCDQACAPGTFGENCTGSCHCENDAACHVVRGTCPSGQCARGWSGPTCQVKTATPAGCPPGKFGADCTSFCRCRDLASCDPVTGNCRDNACQDGYQGQDCQTKCPEGSFGQACSKQCQCALGGSCHHVTGMCPTGCKAGRTGSDCQQECSDGTFGPDCSYTCHCDGGVPCNKEMGHCPGKTCTPGWVGPTCSDRDWNSCVYKGKAYKHGEQWNDGCSEICYCAMSVVNATFCYSKCMDYKSLQPGCRLEVPPGECCPRPVCNWFKQCRYKGQTYNEGESWEDGCDYDCRCLNATSGLVMCRSKCDIYRDLPSVCSLVDVPDQCCPALQCNGPVNSVISSSKQVLNLVNGFVIYNGGFKPQVSQVTSGPVVTTEAPDGPGYTLTPIYEKEPLCYDKLSNCPNYQEYSCRQPYVPWARKNCPKFCGYCPTIGGNSKGEPCVFPFYYRGENYTTCIVAGHVRPWCATTYNYDKDTKWANCHSGIHDAFCTNKISDCARYGKNACVGDYLDWGKSNCARYCGYCDVVVGIPQGTVPPATRLPPVVVPQSTPRLPTPAPATTTVSGSARTECDYHGEAVAHNVPFRRGCQICLCFDVVSNLVSCTDLCIPDSDWGGYLHTGCTLQPPLPGKCCKRPTCGGTLPADFKYPPGYDPNN